MQAVGPREHAIFVFPFVEHLISSAFDDEHIQHGKCQSKT
jgi:hypothetical protein